MCFIIVILVPLLFILLLSNSIDKSKKDIVEFTNKLKNKNDR